jgi:protein-disulfide isomerase
LNSWGPFLLKTDRLALLGAGLQAVGVRETREPQASVTRTAIAPESGAQAATAQRTALAFRGVPLEVYGLGWFLLVLVLELGSGLRPEEQWKRFRAYVFGLSVPALAALAAVWYQMPGGLPSQGLLNLVSAGCVIGVFATAAFSPQPPLSDIRRHVVDDVRLMLARPPLWMAAAAMLAVFATRPSPTSAENAIPTGPTFEAWYAMQPRSAMPAAARGVPVGIVKFIDYECGPCKLAHDEYLPMIKEMQKQYREAIRYVQMDFPLSSECNPFTSQDTHPAACEAAAAANLAVEAGTRPALEAWLWEHQLELTPDLVIRAAREIGGIDNFAERYPAEIERIRADVTTARKMGVNSTPSIFVNGVKLRPLPKEDLRTAILFELRGAGLLGPGQP